VDTAVDVAYLGKRKISFFEVFAGGKAERLFKTPLPADTIAALKHIGVATKGPLATPQGPDATFIDGTNKSLNVRLRDALGLYQCVRPVRWFPGTPSPLKHPEYVDIVIFRELLEDLYKGIEYKAGSPEALEVIDFLTKKMGADIRVDSGIGIKAVSEFGSKRLVRRAIQYAIEHKRPGVTLVGKGNIQKYTEGAFLKWAHEVARDEFGDLVITEAELGEKYNWQLPPEKMLLNTVVLGERITDAMFAELVLRPQRYFRHVIATTNMNGDYISDLIAALVGGLGQAPGANLSDLFAFYEATHGTAPDIAGRNLANPNSLILSNVMMLELFGCTEAAKLIEDAISKAIVETKVTGDLARLIDGAKALSTTEYTDVLIANLKAAAAKVEATAPKSETPAAKAEATAPKFETPAAKVETAAAQPATPDAAKKDGDVVAKPVAAATSTK
jgi:isocitrate dehydrogenase